MSKYWRAANAFWEKHLLLTAPLTLAAVVVVNLALILIGIQVLKIIGSGGFLALLVVFGVWQWRERHKPSDGAG